MKPPPWRIHFAFCGPRDYVPRYWVWQAWFYPRFSIGFRLLGALFMVYRKA